jgi:hypothetical protein
MNSNAVYNNRPNNQITVSPMIAQFADAFYNIENVLFTRSRVLDLSILFDHGWLGTGTLLDAVLLIFI